MTDRFLDRAASEGITQERIYIDPCLETTAQRPQSAKNTLRAISLLKDRYRHTYPRLHYTVGLTNVGYGLGKISRTKALQQAFLKIGRRVGLDSAIADPSILTAEFRDREQALSESIEFMVGYISGVEYSRRMQDSAYDLK